MAVINSPENLKHYSLGFWLGEFAFFSDIVEQLASLGVLHDQCEELAMDEGMVQLDNIAMLQLHQNRGFFEDRLHKISVMHYSQFLLQKLEISMYLMATFSLVFFSSAKYTEPKPP